MDNDQHSLIDLQETGTFLPNDYKAIAREETNQEISIVKQSYKLVPNATLIDKLLRELAMCSQVVELFSGLYDRHPMLSGYSVELQSLTASPES